LGKNINKIWNIINIIISYLRFNQNIYKIRKYIIYIYYLSHTICFIYKSCFWGFYSKNGYWNLIQQGIQVLFLLKMSLHLNGKVVNVWMIEKRLKMNLQLCHLDKILIRYQIGKLIFVQHWEWKIG